MALMKRMKEIGNRMMKGHLGLEGCLHLEWVFRCTFEILVGLTETITERSLWIGYYELIKVDPTGCINANPIDGPISI